MIEKVKREGFVRIRIDGEIIELGRPEPIRLKKTERHTIEAVVDRLVVREGIRTRLADSVETALKWGRNRIVVLRERERKTSNPESFRGPTSNLQMGEDVGPVFRLPGWRGDRSGRPTGLEEIRYTTDYGNAESGFSLGELTPKHFSFNSHLGACPACHGLGTQLVCDADLMVSDPAKSLAEGAIMPWRRGTKRMQAYYRDLQRALVKHFAVDDNIPFADLPETFKKALYYGTGDQPIQMNFGGNGRVAKDSAAFRRACSRKWSGSTRKRRANSPATAFAPS